MPFPKCCFVTGHFRDAYSNYKWHDHIAYYFAINKSDGNNSSGDSNSLYKSKALPPPPA